MKRIKVPTGTIYTIDGDNPLEFLSIGDYGKSNNIKADFLGYFEEINGVEHSDLLPLREKWVITISTQHGCSMGCNFCDVPLVGVGRNVSFANLINQVELAMADHPEVKRGRLNLHYARMGEPTFNRAVIDSAYYLAGKFVEKGFHFHPVVSTMLPVDWIEFKNEVQRGDAGLQLSINSTDHEARSKMFNHNALPLPVIGRLMDTILLKSNGVKGRKITLNFALTGAPIDGKQLSRIFDPEHFMCKITPIHATTTGNLSGHKHEGYDSYEIYKPIEENLKANGFDVLVFVPSHEEDTSKITCGNAILAEKIKDK